jgi:patatin-related protein
MWDNQQHPDEPELPSATPELDLFVTGTNFYGRVAQAVDSTGRVIETKQHRTVFLLKHRVRKGSKCQLDPRRDAWGSGEDAHDAATLDGTAAEAGLLALAKLGQITSCFPGAFAAVHVDAAARGTGEPMSEADQRLKVWGQLPVGEHYFVDGGVLDNKPFTTTLDTIFHRPAHRRVCRHVLYLEPDPERFRADERGKRARVVAPSFIASVLDSMTRLPSYESIADDLARIAEHNATIQRFDELVDGLRGNGNAPPSQDTYATTRLLAIGQRVNAELAEALGSLEFVPSAGGGVKTRLSSEAIGELLKKLTRVVQTVPAAERRVLLKKLDVDFYLRRLLALTYELEKKSDAAAARELWKQVNQEIQWLEIVRSALERVVVPRWIWTAGKGFDTRLEAADPRKLWQEIQRRTLMLLDPRALEAGPPAAVYPPPGATREERRLLIDLKDAERAAFRSALEARLTAVQALDADALTQDGPFPTLLEQCDERLAHLIAASGCALGDFPQRFEEQEDALRFPLEFAARVHQRDQINVVRLSPFDAQSGFSKRALEDKLSGETFGHFGAFLKRSWRSNDILWGRLDGISRLVETFLLHTAFDTGKVTNGRERVLAALGSDHAGRRAFLGRLFPHLEARILAKRDGRDALDALLDAVEAEPELARGALAKLLTETAQLDALCEDLPKVVADAAEEQLEWGQRKGDGRQPSTRARRAKSTATADAEAAASTVSFWAEGWQFRASSGALDTNVLNLATRVLAERSLSGMSPDALGRYFREQYAVGSETAFLTMPVTVLADLGARTAVLAEHALVGNGRIAERIRENGLYRLVVRWPIRLIASLAAFLRRSPQYRISLVVGSLLYVALAVVANVLFAGALYEKDGLARSVALWVFALLPLTALVFAWVIWRSRIGKRLLVGGVVVAAAVVGWLKLDAVGCALHAGCVSGCFATPATAECDRSARHED